MGNTHTSRKAKKLWSNNAKPHNPTEHTSNTEMSYKEGGQGGPRGGTKCTISEAKYHKKSHKSQLLPRKGRLAYLELIERKVPQSGWVQVICPPLYDRKCTVREGRRKGVFSWEGECTARFGDGEIPYQTVRPMLSQKMERDFRGTGNNLNLIQKEHQRGGDYRHTNAVTTAIKVWCPNTS